MLFSSLVFKVVKVWIWSVMSEAKIFLEINGIE